MKIERCKTIVIFTKFNDELIIGTYRPENLEYKTCSSLQICFKDNYEISFTFLSFVILTKG